MLKNPVTPTLNAFNLNPGKYFASLVSVVITALLIFAAIFFFFNLILGGIAWINSAGDKAKLEQARQRVLNAVIGLVVVLSTFVIVNFLSKVFGISLLVFDLNSLRVTP